VAETINGDTATQDLPAAGKERFTCPHCATFAIQQKTGLLWQASGAQEWIPGWLAHRCTSCQEPILWKGTEDDSDMIYPRAILGEAPSADMPNDVQAIYDEARRVASVSRRSAAALLRLALQMLVDQLEPGPGPINAKIGQMVQRGLHPQTQQAMDVLRVVGNNAVHPGQINLDDDPALLPGLFRLTNVIVDQMISIPKHAQSLFNSLPQQARDQISRRDGAAPASSGP
jgi:hypothetical protein